MRIAYSGFFLDVTGYGEAARRMIGALERAGADVRLGVNLGDTSVHIRPSDAISDFLRRGQHEKPVDVHLIHAIGNQFGRVPKIPGARAIGLTCWETSHLPMAVIQGCAAVESVIVPSVDNLRVFAAAGIKTALVPYPAVADIHAEPIQELALLNPRHMLYTICTWQPRKNLEGTLVAMLTGAHGVDGVEIVVKMGGGPMSQRAVEAEVARITKALNLPGEKTPIRVIGRVTDAQMQWLHRVAGSCYVSMSRGEGFAIPVLDALSAGRSIVVSDHGAHRDLLYAPGGRTRCGTKGVPCRLTPVVQDYPLFDGTQLWGDPDLCGAKHAIRDVVTGRRQHCVRDMSMYESEHVGKMLLHTLEAA